MCVWQIDFKSFLIALQTWIVLKFVPNIEVIFESFFKGFRFGMYRGEHVDILYGNVKHAFFQVNELLISFV